MMIQCDAQLKYGSVVLVQGMTVSHSSVPTCCSCPQTSPYVHSLRAMSLDVDTMSLSAMNDGASETASVAGEGMREYSISFRIDSAVVFLELREYLQKIGNSCPMDLCAKNMPTGGHTRIRNDKKGPRYKPVLGISPVFAKRL